MLPKRLFKVRYTVTSAVIDNRTILICTSAQSIPSIGKEGNTIMKSISLVAAVLYARVSLADRDLIFPVVKLGDAGMDTDEYADFKAQVMHVNDDVTTYSVGCATDPCAGWGNLPDFTYTMAIGPSSESSSLFIKLPPTA